MMRTRFLPRFTLLFTLALLPGCGGNDDDPAIVAEVPDNPDGHFHDSEVQGLSYTSGEVSGTTEADGKFLFEADNDVTFNVGDIVLGTAPPSAYMTPITMVPGASTVTNDVVTNIARFLQTIDDDANPANGIVITAAVRTAAAGQVVDFVQTIPDFQADPDVNTAIVALTTATTAGERLLIGASTAQNNLAAGIRAAFAGQYSGEYCRNAGEAGMVNAGTWDMDVAPDGSVSIGFDGTPSFIATGMMDLTGYVGIAQQNGAVIEALFVPDFGGNWSFGEAFGTFSEASGCDNNP